MPHTLIFIKNNFEEAKKEIKEMSHKVWVN